MSASNQNQEATVAGGPGAAGPGSRGGQGLGQDIQAVLDAALGASTKAGRFSASAVAGATDRAATSLTKRATDKALTDPRPVALENDLRRALSQRPRGPALAGATVAALGAKFVRRFGPFRFLARRTPAWLVAAALPALYASLVRGTEELTLVASHLVHRVRAAGLEPDPEKIRHAAVVVMGHGRDQSARSGALVVRWLRRAFRAALPFTAGVATADPDGIARAAATVPLSDLVTEVQLSAPAVEVEPTVDATPR